jgi:hypothetical protein
VTAGIGEQHGAFRWQKILEINAYAAMPVI